MSMAGKGWEQFDEQNRHGLWPHKTDKRCGVGSVWGTEHITVDQGKFMWKREQRPVSRRALKSKQGVLDFQSRLDLKSLQEMLRKCKLGKQSGCEARGRVGKDWGRLEIPILSRAVSDYTLQVLLPFRGTGPESLLSKEGNTGFRAIFGLLHFDKEFNSLIFQNT